MRIFITLLMILLCTPAWAKPISYVGGAMTHFENDETGHMFSADITLTPKLAAAVFYKKEAGGDKDFTTAGPQVNALLKRWNLPDGQGNIFNMTGAGFSRWQGRSHPSIWNTFLADYETRRIFMSYEVKLMDAAGLEQSASQRARVGFAPYLANYNDINTWLMLQADHHPMKDDTFVVTPLARFFYHTTLAEVGYSSNHKVMANLVLQF